MIKKIITYSSRLLLLVFILLAFFVVFSAIPIHGNYRLFTVQSGSMEPTIKTGSLIFVKPQENYNINEIITRRTIDKNVTITHRIAEKIPQANGDIVFKTKGDANNAEDTEFVSPESIVGKLIFNIPYLGYPVAFAKTQQGLILLIIIPAVIIIHEEVQKIISAIKKAKNKDSNNQNEITS